MYLAQLSIEGFRKLNTIDLRFKPGLNVLVGPNNVGKTAVVDALRALLSVSEEGSLRLAADDLHTPTDGSPGTTSITFRYIFADLSDEEEADFIAALKPNTGGRYEAHITIRYSSPDAAGRLRPKRWCADHEDNAVTSEMLEDLRAVYLPPLRDPAQGLRPGRSSQLSRLVQLLSSEASRKEIVEALRKLDEDLQAKEPITKAQDAVTSRHTAMLGDPLRQTLQVGLSPNEFQKIAARLSLTVDKLDVEQNGLGYSNLIYMAVVLSELSLNPDASYKALIVEEPEAHLHPQLQAVLMQYLQKVEKPVHGEKAVQIFVTSHSPTFASIASIETLSCLYHAGSEGVRAFFPRELFSNLESARSSSATLTSRVPSCSLQGGSFL